MKKKWHKISESRNKSTMTSRRGQRMRNAIQCQACYSQNQTYNFRQHGQNNLLEFFFLVNVFFLNILYENQLFSFFGRSGRIFGDCKFPITATRKCQFVPISIMFYMRQKNYACLYRWFFKIIGPFWFNKEYVCFCYFWVGVYPSVHVFFGGCEPTFRATTLRKPVGW